MIFGTDSAAALATIEAATTEILTLVEGLGREELGRTRFTRLEVRRRLLSVGDAAQKLGRELRDAMPELDWDGWMRSAAHLEQGGAPEAEAIWFAVCSLAPSTLGWLRLYRSRRPELFAGRSAT